MLTLLSMLVALFQMKARWRTWVLALLLALPVTFLAGAAIALVSGLWARVGPAAHGFFDLILGAIILAAAGYAAGRLIAARGAVRGPRHRRGAVVSIAPTGPPRTATLTLAGMPTPPGDETKHFKLIGTTGTGKSTAIRELLSGALARGDRAIIADPDGGYLARFYDEARGDVILNPFNAAARKWDLFGEITNDYDVEQLARSLIPDGGEPDRS